MKKISLFLLSIFYIIFFFINPNIIKQNILDVCLIFVFQVMPSIIPMYLFSNLLLSSGILGKLNIILKKFLHFENEYSTSIYLLSILVGNPTTSILINQEVTNKHISIKEGNRLMKFTCFINPLFLLNTCKEHFLILFFSMLLCSLILGFILKNNNQSNKECIYSLKITNIINNLPSMLLNILTIMIMVSIIKSPLLLSSNQIIIYLGDFLEISSGINNIVKTNNLFLLCLLVYSNGLSMLLQTKQATPFISVKTFTMYRLLNIVISTIITLFFHFCFDC